MNSRRPLPRSRGTKKILESGYTESKGAEIEWMGGSTVMRAYVTGEGEPYRPEALFWMSAEGIILGTTVVRPGELLHMACDSLQTTIEQPLSGRPQVPTRVRVASGELAQVLRAGHPELDVVCAATPELDEILELMQEEMAEDGASELSYLSPEITPEAMAAFFEAAAALFRSKPWTQVPDDKSLFSITIEPLGVRDVVMSVIGQMGQSFGFLLFSNLDDFEAYLAGAENIQRGELPRMPPHFVLNYEPAAELAPGMRREVAEHGWEVGGEGGYPWMVAVDEDLVSRPPTRKEVTIAEAIAWALPSMLAEKQALQNAWEGVEPMLRTLPVTTHAGAFEVTLCAPCKRKLVESYTAYDLLAALFALPREGDGIDDSTRRPLEDELLRRFYASPEAKDLEEVFACRFVMNLGADYLGETIATISPMDLEEILFELIPRQVSIQASEARKVIEEVRAFYFFLKREFSLNQADLCLRVLHGNAVKKLEGALSDSSKFGMAKSLYMAGMDAGYDMQSKEGFEAWVRASQGGAPSPDLSLSAQPKPSSRKPAKSKKPAKSEEDKQKAARKAARKARKRNR